jgi:hypothetical protein
MVAVAASAAMVGVGAVATHAVGGPRSNPSGHASQVEPAAGPTNTSPQPTFVPNPAASTFVPISPCRAVDTTNHGRPIKKGKSRSFFLRGATGFESQGGRAGGCGIPVTATAVTATVTSLHQSSHGSLRAGPAGASALIGSFAKNVQNTVGVTLPLGFGGHDLTVQVSHARTDVIIDVTGYYDIQDHLIILADGTVWYGNSHITELIHTAGTGTYTLVFPRSLAGCNVLTTDNGAPAVQASGSWGGSSLTVTTSHLVGGAYTVADESFQVFVVC